jgi:hypothetical protein
METKFNTYFFILIKLIKIPKKKNKNKRAFVKFKYLPSNIWNESENSNISNLL